MAQAFVVLYDYGRRPTLVGVFTGREEAERTARTIRPAVPGSVYVERAHTNVLTEDGVRLLAQAEGDRWDEPHALAERE